jgi:competence protein CoiA
MKFALVNGQRVEAQPHLSGDCPGCGSSMIARCGELRTPHWAHRGTRLLCDPWWENETQWHRVWKDQFPADWQEVVHRAEDGERHIADVKTQNGWVIEFQHSFLKAEERRSRDGFYPKLIWVVVSSPN